MRDAESQRQNTGGEIDAPQYWTETTFSPQNIERVSEAAYEQALIRLNIGRQEEAPELVIVDVDGQDEASVLGREVERVVFDEFFKNDISLLREEYAPYEARSKFLIAIDGVKKRPAGVIRLIAGGQPNDLKSVVDIAASDGPWSTDYEELSKGMLEPKFEWSRTLDVATLAIMPDYRSGNDLDGLSTHLYRSMYQFSRENDCDFWVGILDTKPLEKIQQLGSPLDFFNGIEAAPYIDSPLSIPFYAYLDRIDERIKPVGLYPFFALGEGLDKNIGIAVT